MNTSATSSADSAMSTETSATLYLSGLDQRMSRKFLRNLCEQIGPVLVVVMMRDVRLHRFTGTAFVKFTNHEDAERAMTALHESDRRFAHVIEYAKSRNDPTRETDPNLLYIGGLHRDDVTREKLLRRFGVYGAIEYIQLVREKLTSIRNRDKAPPAWNNSCTFAFMRFATPAAAANALESEDGQQLFGRFIHVQYSTKTKKHMTISNRLRGMTGTERQQLPAVMGMQRRWQVRDASIASERDQRYETTRYRAHALAGTHDDDAGNGCQEEDQQETDYQQGDDEEYDYGEEDSQIEDDRTDEERDTASVFTSRTASQQPGQLHLYPIPPNLPLLPSHTPPLDGTWGVPAWSEQQRWWWWCRQQQQEEQMRLSQLHYNYQKMLYQQQQQQTQQQLMESVYAHRRLYPRYRDSLYQQITPHGPLYTSSLPMVFN